MGSPGAACDAPVSRPRRVRGWPGLGISCKSSPRLMLRTHRPHGTSGPEARSRNTAGGPEWPCDSGQLWGTLRPGTSHTLSLPSSPRPSAQGLATKPGPFSIRPSLRMRGGGRAGGGRNGGRGGGGGTRAEVWALGRLCSFTRSPHHHPPQHLCPKGLALGVFLINLSDTFGFE